MADNVQIEAPKSMAENLKTKADDLAISSVFPCYPNYTKSLLKKLYNKLLLKYPHPCYTAYV